MEHPQLPKIPRQPSVPRLDDPESPQLANAVPTFGMAPDSVDPNVLGQPIHRRESIVRRQSVVLKKRSSLTSNTSYQTSEHSGPSRESSQLPISSHSWDAPTSEQQAPSIPLTSQSLAVRCEGVNCSGRVRAMESHSMIVTNNGELLVFGGTNGVEIFNGVWIFDPDNSRWRRQRTAGLRPPCLAGHCAVLVGDTMFVYGGHGHESTQEMGGASPSRKHLDRTFSGAVSSSRQNIIYTLDLEDWVWQAMPAPGPVSVKDHCAVVVDNLMFIFGGYLPDKSRTNLIHVFDCDLLEWKSCEEYNQQAQSNNPAIAAKAPTPRSGSSAVLYKKAEAKGDSAMVVFGGRHSKHCFCADTYAYQVGDKLWELLPTKGCLPRPRAGHSAAIFGTSMLVFGGYGMHDTAQELYGDLFALDMQTLVWRPVRFQEGVYPVPRCNHTSAILEKGKGRHFLLIFGGWMDADSENFQESEETEEEEAEGPTPFLRRQSTVGPSLSAVQEVSKGIMAMLLMGVDPDDVLDTATSSTGLTSVVSPRTKPPEVKTASQTPPATKYFESPPEVPEETPAEKTPSPPEVPPSSTGPHIWQAVPPLASMPKQYRRPYVSRHEVLMMGRPAPIQREVLLGEVTATTIMAHPPKPLRPISQRPWIVGLKKPQPFPPWNPRPPGTSRKISPKEADAISTRLSTVGLPQESRRLLMEKILGRPSESAKLISSAALEKAVQRLHLGHGPASNRSPRTDAEQSREPGTSRAQADDQIAQMVNRLYYKAIEFQKARAEELKAIHLKDPPRLVFGTEKLQELTRRLAYVPAPPNISNPERSEIRGPRFCSQIQRPGGQATDAPISPSDLSSGCPSP